MNPKTLEFVGTEGLNFGRFGWLEKGALVVMTEKEAADIKGDRRFKLTKDSAAVDNPSTDLEKANSNETLLNISLREMTKEQLHARAKELQTDGKALTVKPTATKAELISLIEQAERQPELPEQSE